MKYLKPKDLMSQIPSFNVYKHIIYYKKIPGVLDWFSCKMLFHTKSRYDS